MTAGWMLHYADKETAVDPRGVDEILLGFARMLRVAGVDVTPDRTHSMLQAVHQLDVLRQDDVYWAGRLTLCVSPDDLKKYDAGFAAYFEGKEAIKNRGLPVEQPRPVHMPIGIDASESSEREDADDDPIPGQATDQEVLRHKDFADLSESDRQALKQMFELLAPMTSSRRSRRFRHSHSGVSDAHRSIRAAMRTGGELAHLEWRDRRVRPRKLVIIGDISGSMAPYSDAILRFCHAAVRRNPVATEVFTLGTRLTRVTRELRQRDPDKALKAAGAAIPDWSGGTQLGEMLRAFLDRWGQRGTARRAIVVIFSDGWERGDPELLGEQMRRLHRLAHKVIWANPHKGHEGYQPLTGGILAALPSIDEFVAGHSFDSYERLARLIADA
ncbi:VWA domain-containing protein [Blastococcus sp. Marseille-P5729]|uniref:vWA domain-containing protein n=1 Tax=Blastococcus sp. Marseille-P5729 TaxID=2086582 RepID=UPI001F1E4C1D|nr:VWA domain-containing protein [Blastococcus sp. Marseille-P5729]